ncbi:hypothetical protein DRW03_33785 [Corallococcus sp. H22C18031201]|uniref:hypothetical protein n=1 Tax=Citreicoccus inhibens TaxID=2849499 RepID=UPI000E757E20|nr:hypothetical protein [Citreicoccus inhibens]MBU8899141.1 hypothetical protein [Citreicoccus inhibens]RJS15214.1 hypothetical protein DRW03_33785 [Corallococcus sp. H22C18031201]
MSKRLFLSAALCLGLAACGSESLDEGANLGMELRVSASAASQLGAFQVVVLKDGSRRSCADLQRTCLAGQVTSDALLMLTNGAGHQARALRFPVNLESASQALEVDVPVGRDYALVIEALSSDSPPRFLGSSCNYLREVNAGRNATLVAAPLTLAAQDCDPTLAP